MSGGNSLSVRDSTNSTFALMLVELLGHVEAAQRFGQDDQRIGVEAFGPSRGFVADRGLDLAPDPTSSRFRRVSMP